MVRGFLIFFLCSWLATMPSLAAPAPAPSSGSQSETIDTSDYLLKDELSGLPRGTEYVSGYYRGAVLMEVNLWGAVNMAGLHHVPMQIDLLTFLSLAGGPTKDALKGEVTITRRSKNNPEVLHVDLNELLENPSMRPPVLQPNDTILIPESKPLVSQDSMLAVQFVSALLSIAVAGILLSQAIK